MRSYQVILAVGLVLAVASSVAAQPDRLDVDREHSPRRFVTIRGCVDGAFLTATDVPDDRSVLSTVRASTADRFLDGETGWRVDTGPKGEERSYETTGTTRPVVAGWGHLQGGTEVVAFAMYRFGVAPGTYRIALDGAGQVSFHVATSPPSMLHPLVARVDATQYTASGLEPPLNAR
jgi:hypothetical protein